MALKLPRLQQTTAIVNDKGQPTPFFQSLFNDAMQKIEDAETAQALVLDELADLVAAQAATVAELQAVVAALQAVSEAAQAAQQAANEAGSGGGGVTSSGFGATNVSTSWVPIVTLSLTGVAAGNLTITGSGPQQSAATTRVSAGTSTGRYRIVEVVSMVDTVVFTGNFSVYEVDDGAPPTTYNSSASAVASFVSAQTSTGAIDYRMDVIIDTGEDIGDLSAYLYVKRA